MNKVEFLKNHILNDEELHECKRIVKTVNRYKTCSNFLEYGFPQVSNYYTEGIIFGSVMCIQKENYGFDYYLLRVSERGQITCEDFQEYVKEVYSKNTNLINRHDAFVLYLLKLADLHCIGDSKFGIYSFRRRTRLKVLASVRRWMNAFCSFCC